MNIKKIAAITVFGLTLTTCSTPAVGQVTTQQMISYTSEYTRPSLINFLNKQKVKQTMLEAAIAKASLIAKNTKKVNATIKKLKQYVGKTWYAFSGDTPSGWDCSGLTMWFYEQMNITLEHRASKQAYAGIATNNPKPGDIVVFRYKGYRSAYHVGIYIGKDQMIHSPRPGYITTIGSIKKFGGNYSNVSYRQILQTN